MTFVKHNFTYQYFLELKRGYEKPIGNVKMSINI